MKYRHKCKRLSYTTLKENSTNFCDLVLGNGFLDMIPKAQASKEKPGKLEFIKMKTLCFKGHYQSSKKDYYPIGKIIVSYISDKRFALRIHNKLLTPRHKRQIKHGHIN